MDKRTLFIKAMQSKCFLKRNWAISAFSITKPLVGTTVNSLEITTPYIIKHDPLGYTAFNPITNEYEKITDSISNEPLFKCRDKIFITRQEVPNLKEEKVETTYGRLLFNYLVLINVFGNKIAYINKEVNLSDIEKIIAANLKDNKPDQVPVNDTNIYIDEYLNYSKAIFFLTGYSQLFSQGITEKILLPPPGIKEFKQKLLDDNKDKLSDMATIANIDAALVEYDSAYLKGDDGENFLISKKSRSTVRKKLFLMNGAESGLDDNNVSAALVTNSLTEGWQIDKFPDMNNSLRAGSFNRGAQTELGGVAVKWLLRASSNMNVTVDDCGTTLGTPIDIDETNKHKLVGFTIIGKTNSIAVDTDEQANTYLGKRVMLRNPMYCKLDKTDYCKICIGKRLLVNPSGLSIAVSEFGSTLLSIFMQSAHSRSLELSKLKLNESIV
jgi:hypothetical protein